MNYIKEINAFYDQIELNPLSASAVALWHTLLHINNKALWKKQFTVAVSVLRTKSGLKETSFKRAREELQEKGYIHFQSRGGNQAAIYEMVSLSSIMDHSMDHSPAPLIKQNETKQNDTTTTADAIVFYQENFGVISPYMSEELLHWIHDLGDPLVLEAMKRAVERNKANWAYLKGILQAWVDKRISDVEEAQAEEIDFKNQQKQQRHRGSRPRKEEVIPGWFKERQHQQEQQSQPLGKPEREQEPGEVADLLANYKKNRALSGVG